VLLGGALALVVALLYARVGSHPFIFYDDGQYVADNARVLAGLSWDNVRWAFTTFHFNNWHPLTWLSYMLDVQIFGPSPGALHLVNVGLHALNAVLVFLVLDRTTGARGRSAFAAALFALHPLRVESVAWIAERKDLLSTAFGLLAIAAWRRYALRPGAGRYALVIACFALSLMAKPMLVTLPFVLLLLDAWPLQRVAPWSSDAAGAGAAPPVSWGRALSEKLPLLALSAASSVATVIAQGDAVRGLDLGIGARIANALVSHVRYVGKSLWPTGLAILYPHPEGGTPAWQAAGAALLLVASLAAALYAARRAPELAVGWLWFLGTLVPVIGLVQVGAQAMADRYTYVPCIGLAITVSWGAHRALGTWRGGRPLAAAGVATLALLSGLTWWQVGFWTDHVTLFRHAVAVTESNARAHGGLALGLRRAGQLDEALAEAREATRLEPDNARLWMTEAAMARELRQLPEAYGAAQRAVALDPGVSLAWTTLADVEADLGRPEAAIDALRAAVLLDSSNVSTWSNLGILLQGMGHTAEATEAFQAAVRAAPENPVPWRNLGVHLYKSGRAPEAARAFSEALRLQPGNPDLAQRLEAAQRMTGEPTAP
jgi:tetratricopeptide (TPR) repeat protein